MPILARKWLLSGEVGEACSILPPQVLPQSGRNQRSHASAADWHGLTCDPVGGWCKLCIERNALGAVSCRQRRAVGTAQPMKGPVSLDQ
jgi:hypothetical protein